MEYLFFDIECCDGHTICSFGYVLTDESFRILQKEDILINPAARFQLGRYGASPEIELAYSRGEFSAAPKFPAVYKQIRSLLCGGRVICGHAVEGDARYVNDACKRYALPHIDFEFADSQVLYGHVVEGASGFSLEKICLSLGLTRQRLHKSDDDAEMTMHVVRELCRRTDKPLLDLIASCPRSQGCIQEGVIKVREPNAYKLFLSMAETLRPQRTGGTLSGKRIYFAKTFARKSPFQMITAAQLIAAAGGRITQNPLTAHIFVAEGDAKPPGAKTRAMNPDAFFTLLGTEFAEIEPFVPDKYTARPQLKKENGETSKPKS